MISAEAAYVVAYLKGMKKGGIGPITFLYQEILISVLQAANKGDVECDYLFPGEATQQVIEDVCGIYEQLGYEIVATTERTIHLTFNSPGMVNSKL